MQLRDCCDVVQNWQVSNSTSFRLDRGRKAQLSSCDWIGGSSINCAWAVALNSERRSLDCAVEQTARQRNFVEGENGHAE